MKKVIFVLSIIMLLIINTKINAYIVGPLPNQSNITLGDNLVGTTTADPYPSIITISNLPTKISFLAVKVTLSTLPTIVSASIDVVLEGPQGQKCLLFSDVGNRITLNNVILTIFDEAPLAMPVMNAQGLLDDPLYKLTAGFFHPTDGNFYADQIPQPAPVGPYPLSLAEFKNINPNGDWKLYATIPFSMATPNAITINNWALIIDIYPQNDYTGDRIADYVLKKGKKIFVVNETNTVPFNNSVPITKETASNASIKGKIIGGADLDGDHISDLIIKKGKNVQGLKGPSFASPIHTLKVKGMKPVASGDFDGDLLPDLYFQKKTSLHVAINTGTGFEAPKIIANNTLPKKFKVFGALSGRLQPVVIAKNKTTIAQLEGPTFSTPINVAQTSSRKVKASAVGQFAFAADITGSTIIFQQKKDLNFVSPVQPGIFNSLQNNKLRGLKIVAPR